MKRFLIITLVIAAFASAVLLTLFVKTTTANADIAAGNQAYAAQDYETAMQRYTAAQAQELVTALENLGREVEYHHIEASFGHDSFLVEVETMTQVVGGYLDRLWQKQHRPLTTG